MKCLPSQRAAAMIVALLTLASAVSISAVLLSAASLSVKSTRADQASVQAERIVLDLEPTLVMWASENQNTSSDDELMPSGWFTIHEFEHKQLSVRIKAIDLTGCVSMHPAANGRADLLPDRIKSALAEGAAGPDATLDSLVDLELLPIGATLYPPIDDKTPSGVIMSEWVTHIDTGGWNTRTSRDELRSLAGIASPDPRQSARDSRAGGSRLLTESNAFAFVIDTRQHALFVRTWYVIARTPNERGRRGPWSIVERRRLP